MDLNMWNIFETSLLCLNAFTILQEERQKCEYLNHLKNSLLELLLFIVEFKKRFSLPKFGNYLECGYIADFVYLRFSVLRRSLRYISQKLFEISTYVSFCNNFNQ